MPQILHCSHSCISPTAHTVEFVPFLQCKNKLYLMNKQQQVSYRMGKSFCSVLVALFLQHHHILTCFPSCLHRDQWSTGAVSGNGGVSSLERTWDRTRCLRRRNLWDRKWLSVHSTKKKSPTSKVVLPTWVCVLGTHNGLFEGNKAE